MARSRFSNTSIERRSKLRFPLELEVRYEFKQYRRLQTGVGQSLNISSSGMLLETEHRLQPGTKLKLAINWPIKLNATASIKLVARGNVVRVSHNKAAIRFTWHEFRLLGGRL